MSCFFSKEKAPPRRTIFLSIYGDISVGKSSLLNCFVRREFPEQTEPTYYDYFSCDLKHGEHTYEVMLFDTPGNFQTACLMPSMLRKSEGIFAVYSEADILSLQSLVLHWLPWIIKNAIQLKCILLIGNKTDLLVHLRNEAEQKHFNLLIEMAQSTCSGHRMQLVHLSAKHDDYDTLEHVFTSFAQQVITHSTAQPSLLVES